MLVDRNTGEKIFKDGEVVQVLRFASNHANQKKRQKRGRESSSSLCLINLYANIQASRLARKMGGW